MSTIFCDNDGCMFSDGCGFCDCDKLSIVGGVCEGSMHGGRNASDGDIDERLKAENAKLRELVVRMRPICMEGQRCTFADRIYINNTMEELRIKVKA